MIAIRVFAEIEHAGRNGNELKKSRDRDRGRTGRHNNDRCNIVTGAEEGLGTKKINK